jgi:hypothetical protein
MEYCLLDLSTLKILVLFSRILIDIYTPSSYGVNSHPSIIESALSNPFYGGIYSLIMDLLTSKTVLSGF